MQTLTESHDLHQSGVATFFIAYAPVESENFLSLPDDLKQKYMDRFRDPEKFFMTAGGIRAVPLRQERVDHER